MSHVLVSTDRFFGKIQGVSDIHKIQVETLSYRFIVMEDLIILDKTIFSLVFTVPFVKIGFKVFQNLLLFPISMGSRFA